MASIRASVIYSFITRFGGKFITLGTMMVVSRILTPSEIGTYAIAASIVMMTAEVRAMGVGSYLIREPHISSNSVRSALGLTILISWGLGLIIIMASESLADFYELPPLSSIFLILSITFFIAPFIAVPSALLAKYFAFKKILKMNLLASVLCSLTIISLAFAGFSFYSLAIGQLVTPLVIFLVLLVSRPKGMEYLPSFRGLAPMARFGIVSSLTLFVRKATVSLPDVVIGKLGPTGDVALFSRGMGLVDFLSQTVFMGVRPVVLPYLSLKKKEGEDVTAAYTKASVMLGAVVIPVLGVASMASLPAIRFFFGDQWDASAPVASALAIWAMFRCAHWLASDALMAVGRENLMLVREGVPFLVMIPLVIVAYPHGLPAVASIFIVAGALDLLITTVILKRVLALRVGYYLSAWLTNFVILAACLAAAWGVKQVVGFGPDNAIRVIGILLLTMPVIWFVTLAATRNPLYFEIKKALGPYLSRKS
jgi:O-antigen/teichoic acid export membrane protein